MKLEIINKYKLKITIKYDELEANGISIHSFLSDTAQIRPLLNAALEIANEDLKFNIPDKFIISDTYSFNNTLFIVYITPISKKYSKEPNYNYKKFMFRFTSLNSTYEFIQRISNFTNIDIILFSLYMHDNNYLLLIDAYNLPLEQTKKMRISFLDEEASYFTSNILISKIKEFNEPIFKNLSITETTKFF